MQALIISMEAGQAMIQVLVIVVVVGLMAMVINYVSNGSK